MQENIIEIKNATVIFDKDFKAIQNINLDLPIGKITGFIGPSGAGKTTLMRSIVGRQKLTDGEITVLGREPGTKQLRKAVNYMTQGLSVYGDLSVRENLRYFATMTDVKRNNRNEIVKNLIATVDLTPQTNQLVRTLSGGQKQRVSLAISLLGKAKLLVLDEPTIGLDPLLRDRLWKLFRKLKEQGVTILITSHAMDEAERCDELVLLRGGEVLAQGSPSQLKGQTETKTVEESFLTLVQGHKS